MRRIQERPITGGKAQRPITAIAGPPAITGVTRTRLSRRTSIRGDNPGLVVAAQLNDPWDTLEKRKTSDARSRCSTCGDRASCRAGRRLVTYLRDRLLDTVADLIALERAILSLAAQHTETLMPAYTHFQHAQPGTFAHYLLRGASSLERDLQRLEGARRQELLIPAQA
jgi:hypothetical protein